MLTAARELKAQGAAAVYAACTHGLFTGGSAPRLLAGGLDRILVTDTCPVPPGVMVASAAPAVVDALRTLAVHA
jgi:ribose-phosphate pyrophosphokinase